jgi:uncharacterized membrane protein YesL
MNDLNNRLFSNLNTIVDLFLLNLLWVIASLPLITFFPATAAMFGVVRKRILKKESEGIFKSFFKMFKENSKPSFIISILWSVFAVFLFFDYVYIHPETSVFQLILYVVWVIGLVLFSAISIYIFPIMVHFDLSWKIVIRNAFFFSLMNPVITILILIVGGIGVVLLYIYPASIFIIGTPLATVVYHLSQIAFNQALNIKKNEFE